LSGGGENFLKVKAMNALLLTQLQSARVAFLCWALSEADEEWQRKFIAEAIELRREIERRLNRGH
jgi:hypothetical protein